MTLSISARCPESGQLGIAISSSSMAVGSRCPWLLPGVGAVASQNITLPSLGPHILGALEAGASVEQALNLALAEDRFREYRQVAAIDANGHNPGIPAGLTGNTCHRPWHGEAAGFGNRVSTLKTGVSSGPGGNTGTSGEHAVDDSVMNLVKHRAVPGPASSHG